jgi:hypothetical protein
MDTMDLFELLSSLAMMWLVVGLVAWRFKRLQIEVVRQGLIIDQLKNDLLGRQNRPSPPVIEEVTSPKVRVDIPRAIVIQR